MFMITTVGMISIKISKGKIYWPKTILRSLVLWRYTCPIIISSGTFFKPILEFHSTFDCCHNQSSPLQLVCHDSAPLAFFFRFLKRFIFASITKQESARIIIILNDSPCLNCWEIRLFPFLEKEKQVIYFFLGSLPWCRYILNAEIFLGNAGTETKNLRHEGGSLNTTGHWYTWHC